MNVHELPGTLLQPTRYRYTVWAAQQKGCLCCYNCSYLFTSLEIGIQLLIDTKDSYVNELC